MVFYAASHDPTKSLRNVRSGCYVIQVYISTHELIVTHLHLPTLHASALAQFHTASVWVDNLRIVHLSPLISIPYQL
jgi:hypothetical protein